MKKIKTLLIPYLIFSILSIGIIYVRYKILNDIEIFTLSKYLSEMLIAKRNFITYNVPLWFLTCLFLVEIIFYCSLKIFNKYMNIIFIFICAFIGCVVFYAPGSMNPQFWGVDAALFYMSFYAIGYFYKNNNIAIKTEYKRTLLYIMIFISASLISGNETINIIFKNRLNINANIYITLKEIFVSSAGIYTIVYLAKRLQNSKLISYIGKNSLIIFALHGPIGFYFVEKIMKLYDLYQIPVPIKGLLYLIVCITSLVPIIFINNRLGNVNSKYNLYRLNV